MFTCYSHSVSFKLYCSVQHCFGEIDKHTQPSEGNSVFLVFKTYVHFRLDTTLVDFKNKQWERGDVSLLFNGDDQSQMALIMLDNRRNIYQKIRYEVG